MKKVLITGASGDLGQCLSLLFSKENYEVIIHYNENKAKAIELKNKILELYNLNCQTVQADISKETEVKALMNQVGNIDVLINNAAYYFDEDFFSKEINTVKQVIDTNIIGTYLMCKEAASIMKQGVIINISSNNGIDNNYQESTDYDMTKAAIVSLTNNLADLLSPNIRVITVAPGWIDTEKNKEMNPDFKQKQKEKILLNRFANPNEIAEVILFLASDKASYINKTVIKIDGGLR